MPTFPIEQAILMGVAVIGISYFIFKILKELKEKGARAEEERTKELMQQMAHLDKMLSLTPTEFENLIKVVFERMGYEVFRTKGSGDQGIDLVLLKEGKKAIVQCKRWKNKVGSGVIREFFGALVDSGAEKGYIVTTSKFSIHAQALVTNKPIHLVDGTELVELIRSYAKDELKS